MRFVAAVVAIAVRVSNVAPKLRVRIIVLRFQEGLTANMRDENTPRLNGSGVLLGLTGSLLTSAP